MIASPTENWTSVIELGEDNKRDEEVRCLEGEENEAEGYPASIEAFACHVCGRLCAPRIGLHNHKRTHATD